MSGARRRDGASAARHHGRVRGIQAPGVLIKAVTCIDVLGGGRVIFGVGAGAPFNVLPPGAFAARF